MLGTSKIIDHVVGLQVEKVSDSSKMASSAGQPFSMNLVSVSARTVTFYSRWFIIFFFMIVFVL